MSTATIQRNKQAKRNKSPAVGAAPRLLNGDHLAVPEFERRYWAMPEVRKALYQRCLVPEYFVWHVMDSQIRWFALDRGDYIELNPRADGIIRSGIFPGLWLDVRALLAGDEGKVSRILERGIKSAEHVAFVRRLASAK